MNPQFQVQILDPSRGQFVQIDGGESGTTALLLWQLIEMRVQTQYLYGIASGNIVNEQPEVLRADALNDPTLFQTK